MKTKIVYITFDNVGHESAKDAERYLDRIYGNKISRISHQIVHLRTYADVSDFIDNNLDKFIELKKIKDDMVLVALHDGDED